MFILRRLIDEDQEKENFVLQQILYTSHLEKENCRKNWNNEKKGRPCRDTPNSILKHKEKKQENMSDI